MQSKVQSFLEKLGMSPRRHNGGFILRRFVLLIVIAVGLIWAKLETNVENLWIEGERGYLPLACIIICKLTGLWYNARALIGQLKHFTGEYPTLSDSQYGEA